MTSPLNPREYDVIELREALNECGTSAESFGSGEIRPDRSHCQRGTAPHSEQDTADRWVSAIDIGSDRGYNADSDLQVGEMRDSVSKKGLDIQTSATDGGIRGNYGGSCSAGGCTSVGGNLRAERDDCGRAQADLAISREGGESGPGCRHRCGQNPDESIYLRRVPDSYSAQMEVLAWIESLVSVCGHDKTLEALRYYESIGWLSKACREQLVDFAAGFAAMEPENQRPLTVTQHRESLRYIKNLIDQP